MITEEQSLFYAIQYTGAGLLPEIADETKIWVRAIARVRKVTTNYEYVVVKHTFENGKDTYSVVKDCGNSSRIYELVSLHPCEYVNSENVPELKTNKDIIAYLCKEYKTDESDFDNLNREKLTMLLHSALVNKQLNK